MAAKAPQDIASLDVTQLTPLTPEIMNKQATINIGTIGHVSHGKSTLVGAISGVRTQRHSQERIRNITIKLGYANAKIFKCLCPTPNCYKSFGSEKEDPTCPDCTSTMVLQRHVSFVDCPGHDILMATMLNGAAVMDAALLLIASNESCPQPQTSEHLAALEIMNLSNIIIMQNKVDLLENEEAAASHYEQIKAYIARTCAANAPIVPISAQLKLNIEYARQLICTQIPIPMRDFTSSPRMIVIRSFDVNKPGEEVANLKGGVAGGSILRGVLRLGDIIEIRPGIITMVSEGSMACTPIRSRIESLKAEKNELQIAVPGGLIGVGLKVDPSITRSDNLVGHVIGLPGQLPEIYTELEVCYYLLKRLLGVKSDAARSRSDKVQKLKKGEYLMVNVGSTSTGGKVLGVKTVRVT